MIKIQVLGNISREKSGPPAVEQIIQKAGTWPLSQEPAGAGEEAQLGSQVRAGSCESFESWLCNLLPEAMLPAC